MDGWGQLSEMTPVDGWQVSLIRAMCEDGVWDLVRFRLRDELTGEVHTFYTTLDNARDLSRDLVGACPT